MMTATLAVCSDGAGGAVGGGEVVGKVDLRRRILKERRGLGADYRARASVTICDKVRGLPEFAAASTVLAFAPMEEEVDIRPLFEDGDRRWALPRITDFARGEMSLHWVDGFDGLVKGRWGIMEPAASAPVATVEELGFWLIPAVGVDARGGRLGYGGGFYDRLLAQRTGVACAVVFGCQVVERVPEGEGDKRADIIVTEWDIMDGWKVRGR